MSLLEAKNYIEQLDIGYIIDAMCAPSYPLPRWIREEAERCAQLYKNFLYLQRKNPTTYLVPTREIDEFWHNHILYTKNYVKDCHHIFGHYFHHEPANPNDPPEKLITGYQKTKELYFAEYNEELSLIA